MSGRHRGCNGGHCRHVARHPANGHAGLPLMTRRRLARASRARVLIAASGCGPLAWQGAEGLAGWQVGMTLWG
jgi:hypothetical protein